MIWFTIIAIFVGYAKWIWELRGPPPTHVVIMGTWLLLYSFALGLKEFLR